MTPVTLIIDRSFKGVGRIKRATGTTNPVVRRKLSRMLTALADDRRTDILRAIRDGHLSMLDVYAAYQQNTLDALPTAATVRPLAVAMKEWVESLATDGPSPDCSARHKGSLETSRRYFERENAKATIADIAAVVESLRESIGREHPRTFNLARAAALAFIRSTLKRAHPLYAAVQSVDVRPVKAQRIHAPRTVADMRELFPNPDSDQVDGIAWGMATTGMGAGEYWGVWSVRVDRIHIEGTKREGRVRDVPLVLRPTVPQMHRRTFEDKLRERSRDFTAYDLRRTYATWMEDAHIPRTRRKLYMGHGAADITDLYEKREVADFLASDAQKLRDFIGLHTKGHTMTLHKRKGA